MTGKVTVKRRMQAFSLKLLGIVLLSLVWIGWSLPALAADKITVSPRLEEQILQVLRNHPEVILESVQAFQDKQQQKVREDQQALLQEFKEFPERAVGNSPALGSANQKIVLVEFSDFQCPYCSQMAKTVKQFVTSHPEITLVYKHYPVFTSHPEAIPAARAAWAAAQQNQFWPFHDALFNHQDKLGEDFYVATAKSLKLDLDKFNRDRSSPEADALIQDDMALGQAFGISGTPYFVMNGETLTGVIPVAELEAALARVQPKAAVPAVTEPNTPAAAAS